ncbi:hypothetical protein BD408DRAFT_422453 [Parasitella parasitica]|nr:hypothetical protein BD408DRAFT_422453 [Parasitella parasitica]
MLILYLFCIKGRLVLVNVLKLIYSSFCGERKLTSDRLSRRLGEAASCSGSIHDRSSNILSVVFFIIL